MCSYKHCTVKGFKTTTLKAFVVQFVHVSSVMTIFFHARVNTYEQMHINLYICMYKVIARAYTVFPLKLHR